MQQVNHNERRTAVIYTDSKITLDSISNAKNHNHLVEEIRKRAVTTNKNKWKIELKWVKAHAGIYGNKSQIDLRMRQLTTTTSHTAGKKRAL